MYKYCDLDKRVRQTARFGGLKLTFLALKCLSHMSLDRGGGGGGYALSNSCS